MDFYLFLEKIMGARNLSIPDISRLTGLSDSTIRSAMDRKQKRVALDVALKLADGLNIPIEAINGGARVKKDSNRKYDPLNEKEARIGRAYGKATRPVQRTVEVALDPYMEDDEPLDNIIKIDFTGSEQRASAGKGIFLEDESMITMKVRLDALPSDYQRYPDRYFGVPVGGNSMEPTYRNNDILIVSKEPVNVGEIGIFTMEGEGYVKELGRGVLHSLNPDYEDIQLTEDIRCNGKVVGVLNPEAIFDE